MPILYYSNDYEKEGDLLVLLDINRRGDKCFVYYPEGDIAIAFVIIFFNRCLVMNIIPIII